MRFNLNNCSKRMKQRAHMLQVRSAPVLAEATLHAERVSRYGVMTTDGGTMATYGGSTTTGAP